MGLLHSLADLGGVALSDDPAHALADAGDRVRIALGADDVTIVTGGMEANFERIGAAELPFDDVALWIVHRHVTEAGGPVAFDAHGGRVERFRRLEPDDPATHIAVRLPTANSAAEFLVCRGAWAEGLGVDRAEFLQASVAPLTLLLERLFEARQTAGGRAQVDAIASIARLLSDTDDMDEVLTGLCNIISGVSGMDHVTIDVLDAESGSMVYRALNETRFGTGVISARWRSAVRRVNPIQQEALASGQPVLMPDIQEDARLDERSRMFFRQALIVSAVVMPLITKDGAIGCLSYASSKPQTFASVALLVDLASQAAMTLRGLQMYRELAESRASLRALNDRLLESMQVEHRLARTDALTGMPNRRYVDEVLEAECERAVRARSALSVSMADIDHFKRINDSYGHDAGDDVLRQVGAMARERAGSSYIAGRYGGDEFVFVMPGLQLEQARDLVEGLRERVETHTFLGGPADASVSISFGVAEAHPALIPTPETLLRCADEALYEAKAGGRNRVVRYGAGRTGLRDAA